MIKEFKTYILQCDGCGKEAKAQSHIEDVMEFIDDIGWHQRNEREHYCPNCQYYEEDVLYVRIKR